MKKITLFVSAAFFAMGVQAQIFSDDFEALSVGTYIGPGSSYWTTWSGTEGGAEDAQITNAQASSGTKSIHFSSTAANGGPQDVVLEFGQQYTTGIFTYQSDLYVMNGANAYFNIQATPNIGQTWALNVNADGGVVSVDDGLTPNLAVGSYTDATWFTIKIEANLTLNVWKAYIDGTLIGTWTNGVNTVASVDLYPIQGSDFYVDDVSFDHQPFTLPNENAAVSGVTVGGNIAGQSVMPTVTVVNAGVVAISSFDVAINYNGNQYNQSVSAANLTSTNSMDVVFTTAVPLAAGSLPYTATVSNVNGGGADDDGSDDAITITINPVVPAPGKMVVGEEATGTWCPWCVRGTVFMDRFEQDYGPYWAGIAVHNGDPMVVADYDTPIGGLIAGYPSALVDRLPDVDPSAMTNDFFARLQVAPTAFMSTTSTWNSTTRELAVTVTADFQSAANNNYKLACVLTEDGVTGTGSGYNQANAYAGGGNGVMGGFELLPSPVPAAQMVYDHVARAIVPSFAGDATSFPATVTAGDVHSKTYTFTLDNTWDEYNIHIIGLLIDPTGKIDNASKSGIEALSIGLTDLESTFKGFTIYPNPASTMATVEIQLEATSDVQMRLIDMSGKEIAARNYGALETSSAIQLNTTDLNAGVYLVEVTVNGQRMTKRLVIE